MLRRFIVIISVATAAVVVAPAWDAIAAGPGMFRSRNTTSRQPATRTYRSYSVSPGVESVPQQALVAEGGAALPEGAIVNGTGGGWNPPARATARPSKPSRSNPSYMRADSKALGRFGQ